MSVDRRGFMTGCAAIAAISITAPLVRQIDPIVRGVRYQNFDWNADRPQFYMSGSLGQVDGGLKPLSYYMVRINEIKKYEPNLVFEGIL